MNFTKTLSIVPTSTRRSVTVPQGIVNPITAWLWGAGGGGGGNDSHAGGTGAAGQLFKITFNVDPGDVLDLAIGTGGLAGVSGASSAAGGAGGYGMIEGTDRWGGGRGGNAGPSGTSGGGGGGGGATVLSVVKVGTGTRNIIAVAAGGGGGGGGGNTGASVGGPGKTDTGSVFSSYVGMNGQDKAGDGGGAGGGGGGWFGGDGGTVVQGDSGGIGGWAGRSRRSTDYSTSGVMTPGAFTVPAKNELGWDIGAYANGGVATQPGTDGYAILQFSLLALPFIKHGSDWKPVKVGYVKISNNWKNIDQVWVKRSGIWRRVSSSTTFDFADLGTAGNTIYGPGSIRAWNT